MSVKDRLQIILVTYNRAKYVERTFKQFFFEGSPVADCEFLVQDNNSTDNTAEIVAKYATLHPNIKYIKHKYNLGIAGTIARAMERADKDYVWIIGDDDKFDFSNWNEVEQAINNNEKMICVARYALPDIYKNSPANQLFQLTFITGGIYNTSLFNDTTIRNSYDNIYTLFPHIPPIIAYINDGGKIYVVNKAIADNGINLNDTDYSYIRGIKDASHLYERTRIMTWILGYSNVITLLNNKLFQNECLEVAIPHKHIYGNWDNFYKHMYSQYINKSKINYFLEIYNVLSPQRKNLFKLSDLKLLCSDNNIDNNNGSNNYNHKENKFYKQMFSVVTEDNHIVIRIFGFKIKFRRKSNG